LYPLELDSLKGRKLLLKVEKTNSNGYGCAESPFKVERICDDLSLIDAFDSVRIFYYKYILYFILFYILYVYDRNSNFVAFSK
jgi:hypothetical protein